MALIGDGKYIGISAKEFVEIATKNLESGDCADGTRLPKEVRAHYASFVGALRPLPLSYYVFTYDRNTSIKIG
jgi:hypothetical protein